MTANPPIPQDHPAATLHGLEVTLPDGQPVRLDRYAGNVCLIVNIASRCGLAKRNYAPLEELQRRYRDRGLRVLAFPSNDFLNQEPGSPEEIRQFCTRFNATFDLFAKVHVRGKDICPLYRYLTAHPDRRIAGPVRWNFQKYLVNRRGDVVAKFSPLSKPLGGKITAAVERLLAEGSVDA